MTISVLVSTYGDEEWETLAERAANSVMPSVNDCECELVRMHQYHGTVCTSRNAAADQATGTHLVFLDGDDELAPGFIGAMTRALEQKEPGGGPLLLTPAVQQIRRGPPGKPFFYRECSLETGNWLVIGTMIPRELFMRIGGFHEHPHGLEDFNLWARAVRAGAEIVKVPDAVYIAHMNWKSKHHKLARNRPAYRAAYAHAVKDAWG